MPQPGDLVFAKVRGWWPWPARLMCQVSPRQYKVFFYGTRQESLVQVDCIWPVPDKLDSFARKYGGHRDYVLALREMKINPDIFAVHDDDLCAHKCMTCDVKRKRQQLKVRSKSQSNEGRDVNGSAEKSPRSIDQDVKMSVKKHTSEVWLVPKFSDGNDNSEEGIKTGGKLTKVNISNKSRDDVADDVSSCNIDLETLNIKSAKIENDESLRLGLKQNLDLTKIVFHEESSDNHNKAVSKYKPPQMVKRNRANSPNREVKRKEKETMKRKMKMVSKMAKQRKLDGTHSIITKIGYPIKKNPLEVQTKTDTSRTTDKVLINEKKLDTIVISECNVTEKFNESGCMESDPYKKPDKTCNLKQFGIDRNKASQNSIFKQIEYPERETDKVSISDNTELEKPKIKLTRTEECAEVGTVTKCKSKLGLGLSSKKNNATSRKDIRNSSKKSDKTDHSKSGRHDEILFEPDIKSSQRKSDKTDHSKFDREVENLIKNDIRSSPQKSDETGHSSSDREDKNLFGKDIRTSKKKSDETELSKSDGVDGNVFKMDIRSSPRKCDKTDRSRSGREDENSFKKVIRSSSKMDHSKNDREETKQGNSSECVTKLIGKKNNCTEIQTVNNNYDNEKSNNGIEEQRSDSLSRNGDNFIDSFRLDIHEMINMEEDEDALEMEVSYGLLETSNESEIEDEGVCEENILERDLAITDDSSEEEDTKPLSPL